MKRRSFIAAIVMSCLGIGGLAFFRWTRGSDQKKMLAWPRVLSHFCDEHTIEMLGQAYLKSNPAEASNDWLLNDLLTENAYRIFIEQQNISIAEYELEKRIVHDFDTSNIIVVQGWILSVTEARQCALFSILNA